MFIPIGHDGPSQQTPWMTFLIIAVCTGLQVTSSLEGSIVKKVDAFCRTGLGMDVTEALKDQGMHTDPLEDECLTAAGAIITGKARTLAESGKMDRSGRENLRKLVTRAEAKLDIWGWHAFQPKRFSIVSLFTANFFHDGWIHLVGNMLFLWIFGSVLEDLIGPFNLLGLFLGAGVFANLIYFVAAGIGLASGLPTLGASAGIYGILAGVWRKLPRLKITCVFWVLVFIRTIPVRATWLIGFYVFMDAFSLLTGDSGGVNLIAHLAGFAAVFLMLEQTASDREYSLEFNPHRFDITPGTK
jgi:membrane associated rhomboid family serine protease